MQAVHHSGLWSLPHTGSGKTAVALAGVIAVVSGYMGLLLADGQRRGETFFDNLVLAIPALMILASAVLSTLSALVAVRYRGERSVLVYGAVALAAVVTFLLVAELLFSSEPFVFPMHGRWP